MLKTFTKNKFLTNTIRNFSSTNTVNIKSNIDHNQRMP